MLAVSRAVWMGDLQAAVKVLLKAELWVAPWVGSKADPVAAVSVVVMVDEKGGL